MTDPIAHMNGWDYLPNNLGPGDGNLKAFMAADSVFNAGQFPFTIPGAFGGTALAMGNSTTYEQFIGRSLAGGTVVGFRWVFRDAAVGNSFALVNSPDGNRPVQINFNSNGSVSVTVGGVTYTSAAAAFLVSTWFYVQFKFNTHLFELKINGDTVINSTAVSIVLQPFDSYLLGTDGQGSSNNKLAIDDLYILDASIAGGTDYLGNVRVLTQNTSGAGDTTDLVPTGITFNWQAGENWQLNSATYNSTPTVGQFDLYQLAASVAARQIYGIQVKGGYTQDNGTQLYGKNQIKTGGTVYGGTQRGCNSVNYKLQDDYWSKDPLTGDDWTSALLNALQAGPLLAASD